MKLWIDATNPAPQGYRWCKRINNARDFIETHDALYRHKDVGEFITLIDIGHETMIANYGKIAFLEFIAWLDTKGYKHRICFHSSGKSTADRLAIAEAARAGILTGDDTIIVDPDTVSTSNADGLGAKNIIIDENKE